MNPQSAVSAFPEVVKGKDMNRPISKGKEPSNYAEILHILFENTTRNMIMWMWMTRGIFRPPSGSLPLSELAQEKKIEEDVKRLDVMPLLATWVNENVKKLKQLCSGSIPVFIHSPYIEHKYIFIVGYRGSHD